VIELLVNVTIWPIWGVEESAKNDTRLIELPATATVRVIVLGGSDAFVTRRLMALDVPHPNVFVGFCSVESVTRSPSKSHAQDVIAPLLEYDLSENVIGVPGPTPARR
jgi:hypothetical protein